MSLPASLSLGVLLLPSDALLVVTRLPLIGLRIKALGVDVVTVLIIGGSHPVQRRIELVRLHVDTLVGLLKGQRDAATVEVDVDDLDHDIVVDANDLLRDFDVALGQLGHVDQTLNAVLDADESAKRNELGDLARNNLTNLVQTGERLPRILLGRFEGQRDALTIHVDVQHLDSDRLTNLDDLARVVDMLPGQLGDVD